MNGITPFPNYDELVMLMTTTHKYLYLHTKGENYDLQMPIPVAVISTPPQADSKHNTNQSDCSSVVSGRSRNSQTLTERKFG